MTKFTTLRAVFVALLLLASLGTSAAFAQASAMGEGSGDYGDGPCPRLGCEMDDHPTQGSVHWFQTGLPTAEHCQGVPSAHGTCHDSKPGACWEHPSCLTGLAVLDKAVREGDLEAIRQAALAPFALASRSRRLCASGAQTAGGAS